MTVYVIVSKETDSIALRRVFASHEIADAAMIQLASWIAPAHVIRESFEVAAIEVEDNPAVVELVGL
jgi:hypothetical protein